METRFSKNVLTELAFNHPVFAYRFTRAISIEFIFLYCSTLSSFFSLSTGSIPFIRWNLSTCSTQDLGGRKLFPSLDTSGVRLIVPKTTRADFLTVRQWNPKMKHTKTCVQQINCPHLPHLFQLINTIELRMRMQNPLHSELALPSVLGSCWPRWSCRRNSDSRTSHLKKPYMLGN